MGFYLRKSFKQIKRGFSMKKLITIILLLLVINPVFAGNLLQQEFETKKQQEAAMDSRLYNISKEQLLYNDYIGYLNGQKAFYGGLVYGLKNENKNSLDFKYINLMYQQYNARIQATNPQLFRLQKIIVDDDDYKLLKDETKEGIAAFNLLAY